MSRKAIVLAMMVSLLPLAEIARTPELLLAQLIFGQRCQTPQIWCVMVQPAPVGTQCFCPSPLGLLPGVVVL
jgi:hypothetical protein